MSDIYKLQYNGMTLAYPGWNGYVGFKEGISYVQFGAAGNAIAKMYVTATYNGATTSWNNGTSTAYKEVPVGATITYSAVCPDYYRMGSCIGSNVDGFTSASTVSYGKTITGTCTVKDTSGYVTTNNTHTNTFTARGNMMWKDVFTGTYQGSRDAYPALQITAWTGTQPSSTMTGGVGTSYGASGTTKAACFNGSTKCWKSITDWQSTSLKAPVNASAWKFSGTMTVAGKHNQGGSYGTEAAARAMTACANVNGTSTARTYTSANGWITSNGQGTTTGSFTVTATAAKCGTATNQGSYVPGFTLYNYGTITVGSGGFNSWAHNKVTAFSGPWYASGILP